MEGGHLVGVVDEVEEIVFAGVAEVHELESVQCEFHHGRRPDGWLRHSSGSRDGRANCREFGLIF